jgi:hypothetical protein
MEDFDRWFPGIEFLRSEGPGMGSRDMLQHLQPKQQLMLETGLPVVEIRVTSLSVGAALCRRHLEYRSFKCRTTDLLALIECSL